VKSASRTTAAAKKSGAGFVRRAVRRVRGAVAPLLSGSTASRSDGA
jgi:hypothetical protein